jgi:hypothetical protein
VFSGAMNSFAQFILKWVIARPRVRDPNGSARSAVNARCIVEKSTKAGGLTCNCSNDIPFPKTLSATMLTWNGSVVEVVAARSFLASMIRSTHCWRAVELSAYKVYVSPDDERWVMLKGYIRALSDCGAVREVTRVISGLALPPAPELTLDIVFVDLIRWRGVGALTVVVIVPTNFPTLGFETASPVTPSRTIKSTGIA